MKMLNLFIAISIIVSVTGCKGKEKVPGHILSQEKMKVVLEDMIKADQFLADYVLNRDTSRKREPESIELYNKVFAIHKITPDKFFKSFDFYKQHPILLKPILDSLSKPVQITPVAEIDSVITPIKKSLDKKIKQGN